MSFTVRTTQAPSSTPVSLEEVKAYLRIDTDADDGLIGALIETATDMVEHYLRRALITQTLELTLDAFVDPTARRDPYGFTVPTRTIRLPRPPLQAVSSVEYFDRDDTLQTVASSVYVVDDRSEPGELLLANAETWPSDVRQVNAVRITYTAGYGDKREAVPRAIRTAMLRLLSHLYDHRDDVESKVDMFPFTVRALLSTHRSMWA